MCCESLWAARGMELGCVGFTHKGVALLQLCRQLVPADGSCCVPCAGMAFPCLVPRVTSHGVAQVLFSDVLLGWVGAAERLRKLMLSMFSETR